MFLGDQRQRQGTEARVVEEHHHPIRFVLLDGAVAPFRMPYPAAQWIRQLDLIGGRTEGIIVTTGCPSGEIQTRLRMGDLRGAAVLVPS